LLLQVVVVEVTLEVIIKGVLLEAEAEVCAQHSVQLVAMVHWKAKRYWL
jgi:hypothetical protein